MRTGEDSPMDRVGEQQTHWGRRALLLALNGGLVGWFVTYVGALWLINSIVQIQAPSTVEKVADWGGAELILVALALGAPSGAVLGLVAWLVWFLVKRRSRRRAGAVEE